MATSVVPPSTDDLIQLQSDFTKANAEVDPQDPTTVMNFVKCAQKAFTAFEKALTGVAEDVKDGDSEFTEEENVDLETGSVPHTTPTEEGETDDLELTNAQIPDPSQASAPLLPKPAPKSLGARIGKAFRDFGRLIVKFGKKLADGVVRFAKWIYNNRSTLEKGVTSVVTFIIHVRKERSRINQ